MNARVVVILFLVAPTWTANILYLAMTVSPSHTIWDKTLAMALRKNHQITFVSHGPVKNCENFTSIILEGVMEKMQEEYALEGLSEASAKIQIDFFFEWMYNQSLLDARTQGLQTLINLVDSGEKFDLVMWDISTGQYLYPIIEKLKFPPLILTSPFGLQFYHTFNFGNSLHTSYIPLWMMHCTDEMTFSQRVENLIYTVYGLYMRQYYYMASERQLSENLFGNNITSFEVIDKHASFLLSNSDPVLDYPQPVPPSIINVGGLHVKRLTELQKDLKAYLDESKHGVILFSLGTNMRSDNLGKRQLKALIKGLSKLKQNVIWKFESEIENLPKNVIVRKWLPQNEILAHPNMKLFITHGGALSTQEAMYHGVPVVGLPFFADQLVNMHKIVKRKLGLKLNYNTLTADDVYNTINEVLTNSTYRANMKTVSKRYRDQPQNALERAVFWVEYALRNGGGQHLRIAARDMSYVQMYFLDLLALIFGVLGLVVYVTSKLVRSKTNSQNIKVKTQ